jgi:hypothetical protein
MALDARLWDNLEAHGLTTAHLQALLAFLDCRRQGVFAWHAKHGHLDHCELHLSFPARTYDLTHVAQYLFLDGEQG